MKNCIVIVMLLFSIILLSCKKDEAPNLVDNTTSNKVNEYSTRQIFTEPWGAADANTEVTGLAYDSTNDQIFWTKCRWQFNNELMRYNLVNNQYDYVYSYQGQYDYGLRIFRDDLWLVKTYDTTLVQFSSLSSFPISIKKTIVPTGTQPSVHNINDIAFVAGNMYAVNGNVLSIPSYNGLQCLRGPNYNSVERVTQEIWPTRSYVDFRSIVGVGNDLAIATGDSGAIELRDTSGNLLNSRAGYGNSYLQIDSHNRIYSMMTYPAPVKVIRWSADLVTKEEFAISTSPSLYGSHYPLFVVRENKSDSVDVIMTTGRGTGSPVFQMVTLPK